MSQSIGLGATLSLNTGQFTRELDNAKRSYQRTVREMERTSGETFKDILRGVGSTGRDFRSARMSEVRGMYQRGAVDTSWQNSIRTMSASQAQLAGMNRQQDNFLNTAIKVEAALQATRLVINASVVGAKLLAGEFKSVRETAEAASKLPIIGGVVGAVLGAYDYTQATDLKDAQKAEQEKARKLREAYVKNNAQVRAQFAQEADDAEYEAVRVGLDANEKKLDDIERSRSKRVAAIRRQLEDLRAFGQVDIKVRQEAERAIRGINSRAQMETQFARDTIRFEAEAKAKEEAEKQQKAAAEAARRALEGRRDNLNTRLDALRSDAADIGRQSLPVLTGLANQGPGGAYVTGSVQRESPVEEAIQEVVRQLEEVNNQLRADAAVRVGNN